MMVNRDYTQVVAVVMLRNKVGVRDDDGKAVSGRTIQPTCFFHEMIL